MNLSTLPDSHPVYVDGHGAATAGEVCDLVLKQRDRTESERIADTNAATVRMWVAIRRYAPRSKPWQDGHIDVDGKRYPLSVFTSDALVRLSTSSGSSEESVSNDPSSRTSASPSPTSV